MTDKLNGLKDMNRILSMKTWWTDKNALCFVRTAVSIVLGLAALAMLIINIKNGSTLMAELSAVLVGGFAVSAFCSGVLKKPGAAGAIIGLLVCFVISMFAVSGGNEGFAILWVLLVPLFAVSLLGTYSGTAVSGYFFVFLILLFWSPLREYVADKYTASFISRFPVLYICDFLVSMLLAFQKEYYYRKAHIRLYMDELTGIYNRRYFMERVKMTFSEKTEGIMVIDLNGLKQINDTYGHEAGDELISAVPKCCREVFGEDVTVCRMGGDEFAVVYAMNGDEAEEKIKQLKTVSDGYKGNSFDGVHLAVGWASSDTDPDQDMMGYFKAADERMYADKMEYYKTHDRRR